MKISAALPFAAFSLGVASAFAPGRPLFSTRSSFAVSQQQQQGASPSSSTSLNIFQDLLKSFQSSPSEKTKVSNDYDVPIADAISILNTAAKSKSEDPETVVTALEDLEKLMRQKCKAEPNAASEVLRDLDGSWRLVFTTGTKTTQDRIKKTVNYFPVKAVQSFDTSTDPYGIENGIYLGDFALVKFSGPFDFNLTKRKLEFDFTKIALLGFEITIKGEDAAKIGASTGLGSESNVANSEKGKRPFFNWISADETIATARGGGGGLALWKRIEAEESLVSES